MDSEVTFRVALIAVLASTLAVTALHRLRASTAGERISHRAEGYLFATVLRLTGLGVLLTTLAYLVDPALVRWGAMPLPSFVRWCGAVTGALCPLLMYWTLSNLGKNLTDTVVTRSAATLVTGGPYRWIRHPFYGTCALLFTSMTLLSGNWVIGLGCLIVLVMLAVRTPKEEQMLIEKFGQQYRDYMAKTGRFVPRFMG